MASGSATPVAAPPAVKVSPDRVIHAQLGRVRRQIRITDLIAGIMLLLAGTLAYLLVIVAVDHWVIGLGFAGRLLALAVLIGGASWHLGTQVIPLLLRRINPAYAAQTIERGQPAMKNSLLNYLLLRREGEGVAGQIYQAVQLRAAAEVARVEVDQTVDRTVLIRAGYVLAGMMAFVAAYTILSPKDLFQTVRRIANPWSEIARPARVSIDSVEPGNADVVRGQPVDVTAVIRGQGPNVAVKLICSSVDRQVVDQVVVMKPDSAAMRHLAQLPPGDQATVEAGVRQDFVYRIEAGDAVSAEFRLRVVEAPLMTLESVEYDYPAYTARAREVVERQGDLRAIEGTRVTVRARANQPIRSAAIELFASASATSDATATLRLPMQTKDQDASSSWVLELSHDQLTPKFSSYRATFQNSKGQSNRDPVTYRIDVIRDLVPEVEILSPKKSIVQVPVSGEQRIEVRAIDPDFGLSSLRLKAVCADREVLDQPLLEDSTGRTGQVVGQFRFRPKDWQLTAGSQVTFWAVAADNRRTELSPQPNTVRTASQSLIIVDDPATPSDQTGEKSAETAPPQPEDPPAPSAAEPQRDRATGQGKPEPDSQSKSNSGESNSSSDKSSGKSDASPEKSSAGKQQPGAGSQSGSAQPGNSGQPQQGGSGQSGQPANSQSGQSKPDQSKPDQSNSGQSKSGQSNSGQSSSGQTPSGGSAQQPSDDQNRSGQNPSGNPSPGSGEAREGERSAGRSEKMHDGEVFEKALERLRQQQPPPSDNERNQPSNDPGDSSSADKNPAANDAERKGSGKPGTKSPGTDKSSAGKSSAGKSGADKSGADKSSAVKSGAEKSGAEKSGAEKSGAEKSGAEKSGAEKSGAEKSGAQKSGAEKSGAEKSGAEKSGAEKSGAEKSGSGDPTARSNTPPDTKSPAPNSDSNKGEGKEGNPETGEPPAPNQSDRPSDTQGQQSGDRSGAGKKGAGQGAKLPGKDSAGSTTPSDEGQGAASEPGKGEAGKSGGKQQPAPSARPDGSSGTDRGPGSKSQPNPAGNQSGGGADPSNPDPAGNNLPPSGTGQAGNAPASSGPPTGGGSGSDRPPGTSAPGAVPPGDDANLEYARRATDMVLEYLKDQKDKPDDQLLDELGWSAEELRAFLDRWQALKQSSASDSASRREWDDSLRGLGLRPRADSRRSGGTRSDDQRGLRESGIKSAPPPAYQERFNAFKKGAALSKP